MADKRGKGKGTAGFVDNLIDLQLHQHSKSLSSQISQLYPLNHDQ